jgi:hypothetical protein
MIGTNCGSQSKFKISGLKSERPILGSYRHLRNFSYAQLKRSYKRFDSILTLAVYECKAVSNFSVLKG